MNRKRIWMLVAFLVLGVGGVFLLQSKEKSLTLLRLKIVGQAVEMGRPVVFFRVEGDENKSIQIGSVYQHVVDRMGGSRTQVRAVLDESQRSLRALPISDPKMSRKAFGVLVLTNARVWNLSVVVRVEFPPSERFKTILTSWKGTVDAGGDLATATRFALRQSKEGYTVLTSDLITNALPTLGN